MRVISTAVRMHTNDGQISATYTDCPLLFFISPYTDCSLLDLPSSSSRLKESQFGFGWGGVQSSVSSTDRKSWTKGWLSPCDSGAFEEHTEGRGDGMGISRVEKFEGSFSTGREWEFLGGRAVKPRGRDPVSF